MRLGGLRLAIVTTLLALACSGGSGGGGTDPGTDPGAGDDVAPELAAEDAAEPEATLDAEPDAEPDAVADVEPPADVESPDPGPVDVPADPGATDNCERLKQGTVKDFLVDGVARTLVVTYPSTLMDKKGWPVVFNWHGFGDSAANMKSLMSPAVNSSDFPLILITPEDAGEAFDWDITQVPDASKNKDLRLFDEVLACLDQRFGVDWDRVHSVGFSAGGIMTDLLGVARGDKIASLVSFSGGYFANPADVADIPFNLQWPEPVKAHAYPQVILYGGPKDQYNAMVTIVKFFQFALNDTDWLTGLGHDVILCNHNLGHTVPSGFMAAQVAEFFKARPKGTVDSPYAAAGLPADFPAYCEFHGKK